MRLLEVPAASLSASGASLCAGIGWGVSLSTRDRVSQFVVLDRCCQEFALVVVDMEQQALHSVKPQILDPACTPSVPTHRRGETVTVAVDVDFFPSHPDTWGNVAQHCPQDHVSQALQLTHSADPGDLEKPGRAPAGAGSRG